MDVDSNLRMLIINPSPNHLTTTPLAAQGQYFKQQTILLCERSVSKLRDKAKYFKIKA